MSASEIQSLFANAGGKFWISATDIQNKLSSIKAYIFDWDGVFNNGFKKDKTGSGFSEPDAMGTNLLRFSHWLIHGNIPPTTIITGEDNEAAALLGTRENFSALFFKSADKQKSFQQFLSENNLKAAEVAFVFDDVLDLSVAALCALRISILRKANPTFNKYLTDHHLTDYSTGASGGEYAVREACELMIALRGNYDEVLHHRIQYSDTYQKYLADKKKNNI